MSEAFRIALIAALAIAAGFTWLGLRTAAIPIAAPERLIAELRLAQSAALLLATTTGAYIGFAVAHENVLGTGIDIALAVGFFVVAAATLVRDPRQALTIIALAFATHAIVDIAHRPGILADAIAPRWYAVGCAVFNVYLGAIAYYPILRR
jgi:hypothetical protein